MKKFLKSSEPSKKSMILGGVQFGLSYGITNTHGKISELDSIEIIRIAISKGVKYIDTAAAYGDSEKIIGKALEGDWFNHINVITKLLPIKDINSKDYSEEYFSQIVRNMVFDSCKNLNSTKIHTVMLHRAKQLENNLIIKELLSLKKDGILNKIGVSVQNPKELKQALINENISTIQMPFNILDHRWDSLIDYIQSARNDRGVEVHARSALLQGLLCTNDIEKWESAAIFNYKEIVSWLNRKYKQHKKISIPDLCVGYVNSQDWIDSVVLGVDNKTNLYLNLKSISEPFLSNDILNDLSGSRPIVSEDSLDPSNWREL